MKKNLLFCIFTCLPFLSLANTDSTSVIAQAEILNTDLSYETITVSYEDGLYTFRNARYKSLDEISRQLKIKMIGYSGPYRNINEINRSINSAFRKIGRKLRPHIL